MVSILLEMQETNRSIRSISDNLLETIMNLLKSNIFRIFLGLIIFGISGLVFQFAFVIGYDVGTYLVEVEKRRSMEPKLPYLTLFCFVDQRNMDEKLMSRTIENWALHYPVVQPVMYVRTTNETFVKEAVKNKWHVYKIEQYFPGQDDYPTLKELFTKTKNTYKSAFIGYSEDFVLFGDGLSKSIEALLSYTSVLKTMLVIGRSREIDTSVFNQGIHPDPQLINKIAESHGIEGSDYSQNFIITHRTFTWDDFPDFIIGGLIYDNWLVVKCLNEKIPAIDTSKTIKSVSQTAQIKQKDTLMSAKSRALEHNRKIQKENQLSLFLGCTSCVPLETFITLKNNTELRSKKFPELQLVKNIKMLEKFNKN